MSEIVFISNKTRKEVFKYLFLFFVVIVSWVLQIAVFSRFEWLYTAPNLLLVGCIFFGLVFGVFYGSVFGIACAFLSSSILYDHVFYFSYILIGFLSGLLIKNIFLNEFVLFVLLSFLLSFPFEFLNGLQYTFMHPTSFLDRYLLIGTYSSFLNMLLSVFYYWILRFLIQKIKL